MVTAEAIRQRLGFSTITMPGDTAIGAREMAAFPEEFMKRYGDRRPTGRKEG
jgi:hypothetical protein